MGLEDVIDNRQTESRAFLFPRKSIVDAVELLKNALVLGNGNALAVVADRNINRVSGFCTFDFDLAGISAVFSGIGQQIEQGVRERPSVCENRCAFRRHGDIELHVLIVAHRLEGIGGGLNNRAQIGIRAAVFAPATLHASPVKQAVDQFLQTCRFFFKRADALAACVGIIWAQRESFREETNRGERSAQLVAHLGNEVALQARDIGLSAQEDPDQNDARDHGPRERNHEDAHEHIRLEASEEEHDHTQGQKQYRRHDIQGHQEQHDAPVAKIDQFARSHGCSLTPPRCTGHLGVTKLEEMALPEATSERKRASRGRFFWLSWVVLGLFLSGLLVRQTQDWILDRAVARSLSLVRKLDQGMGPKGESEADALDGFFPLLPFQEPGGAAAEETKLEGASAEETGESAKPGASSGQVAKQPVRRAPSRDAAQAFLEGEPPIAPPPASSRASKESVLAWANAQFVPRGRSVPASHGMPAGIEVFDVGGLGLGLVERDRLIAVDGVAVGSRSEVVAAALAARGREQEVIQATLMRRTAEGPQRFTVTIEQPYLEPEPSEPVEDQGEEE